jgi:ribosomal protein S18 acetylase RimI-like enzyme
MRELYTDFMRELPPPPGIPLDLAHELQELQQYVDGRGVALVADDEAGNVLGFALGEIDHPGQALLTDVYVVPDARRRGLGSQLVRAFGERLRAEGAVVVTLSVQVANAGARAAYERLGFQVGALELFAPIDALLEEAPDDGSESDTFGSVHVQTDDERAVEQAVRKYVPRLGRSAGTVIAPPRNGWIGVYDELCSRDPDALRRLATELSNATGAVVLSIGVEEGAVVRYLLFDRGSVVDEYLSVPEHYGPLAPGDAIALAANATVVGRLTGAQPAAVRAVARTAAAPTDLPPPHELLTQIAEVMGISGAEWSYQVAVAEAGGVTVEHR